jgi:hypothetical protein
VEKTDALLELLDQVEDVIGVAIDTICDKTAHSLELLMNSLSEPTI